MNDFNTQLEIIYEHATKLAYDKNIPLSDAIKLVEATTHYQVIKYLLNNSTTPQSQMK